MFIQAVAEDLPLYHEDQLIVKLRPEAAPVIAAAAGAAAAGLVDAPGLSTLAVYERAGLVKRVVPLARRAVAASIADRVPALAGVAAAGFGMGGIAAAAVASDTDRSPTGGFSLVELKTGTNLQELQSALSADPSVVSVSRVPVRYLAARPLASTPAGTSATPPPANTLWNLKKIQWDEARGAGLDSAADVRVAVLDTGVDSRHPDLPAGLRYVHSYPTPGATAAEEDVVGHGTHVTGTICALINNDVGINGICACSLSAYKIFEDTPTYSEALGYFVFLVKPLLYRQALLDCSDADMQVINLSIAGYGTPDDHEAATIQELIGEGRVVVAAMGNENTSAEAYPAAIPGVVSVGATSINDSRASFSNYGNHIDLVAPGVGIWSTMPTYAGRWGNRATTGVDGKPKPGHPIPRDVDYGVSQGTSMAAPHVSAAAALAIARHGAMSAQDVRELLREATDQVPGMGNKPFTSEYGTGRLNLAKLV